MSLLLSIIHVSFDHKSTRLVVFRVLSIPSSVVPSSIVRATVRFVPEDRVLCRVVLAMVLGS